MATLNTRSDRAQSVEPAEVASPSPLATVQIEDVSVVWSGPIGTHQVESMSPRPEPITVDDSVSEQRPEPLAEPAPAAEAPSPDQELLGDSISLPAPGETDWSQVINQATVLTQLQALAKSEPTAEVQPETTSIEPEQQPAQPTVESPTRPYSGQAELGQTAEIQQQASHLEAVALSGPSIGTADLRAAQPIKEPATHFRRATAPEVTQTTGPTPVAQPESLTSEPAKQIHSASTPYMRERGRPWSSRLRDRRWWLNAAWYASCTAAMLAVALLVNMWLFRGGEPSGSGTTQPTGTSTTPHSNQGYEPEAGNREVNHLQPVGPTARIVDLLPAEGESSRVTEASYIDGPLTNQPTFAK